MRGLSHREEENPWRRLALPCFCRSHRHVPHARLRTNKHLPAEKLNAYVGCINRLSERSYESRKRYFMGGKTGPTGKERIIYGTYTIYDTSDCRKSVEKANALEPRDAELEAAASAYADAVSKLEPLLKEADDYYAQENYKDDKMAKGKAMHPRLVAAWDAFASADKELRDGVEAINDKRRGGTTRRDRGEGRPQGALSRRGADDPGQARVARRRHRQARHRGDHAGAERV